MKALKFTLLALAAVALLASCTTFKSSGLSMSLASSQATVVGSFQKEVWVHEFLGSPAGANIFNISAENADGAVKQAITEAIREKGGTAAVDITITHQASFLQMLLNGFTFSLYAPGTVIVTGTVIK